MTQTGHTLLGEGAVFLQLAGCSLPCFLTALGGLPSLSHDALGVLLSFPSVKAHSNEFGVKSWLVQFKLYTDECVTVALQCCVWCPAIPAVTSPPVTRGTETTSC